MPTADQGSILITTRLSRLRGIGGSSKITEMNKAQSRSLLEAKAGMSIEGIAQISPKSNKILLILVGWEKLVDLLGGLPLALALAGSYLGQNQHITVDKYIEFYNDT